MSTYGLMLQSMAFLLVIIILAYLAVRYGLRSIYQNSSSGQIKVIERVVLDPKTGSLLLLVQIGSEVHLVGASQGGISLLKTIEQQNFDAADHGMPAHSETFKASLNSFLKKIKGSMSDDQNGDDRGSQ